MQPTSRSSQPSQPDFCRPLNSTYIPIDPALQNAQLTTDSQVTITRNTLPNQESEPGVYKINVTVTRSDRQQCRITIYTNTGWNDFCTQVATALGSTVEHCANNIELRHSRAQSQKLVWVNDDTQWTLFMDGVRRAIETARKNEVTIDVQMKEPAKRPPTGGGSGIAGTKRAPNREDDIPRGMLYATPEERTQSYEIFTEIKDITFCHGCTTRHAKNTFCIVDKDKRSRDNHRQISLEFIARWAHFVLQKKADKFTPPNCLLTDKADVPGQDQRLPAVAVESELTDPTPTDSPRYWPRPRLASPEPRSTLSSPDLPEPGKLVESLIEKDYEELGVTYPSVDDALEAIDAIRPDNHISAYKERLHSTGYHYINHVARRSVEEVQSDTGMFFPQADELHRFSKTVSRVVKLQQLKKD